MINVEELLLKMVIAVLAKYCTVGKRQRMAKVSWAFFKHEVIISGELLQLGLWADNCGGAAAGCVRELGVHFVWGGEF